MTVQQLAREALAVFELQREYFKTKNQEKLAECKKAEAALKKKCNDILNPPKDEHPTLDFDTPGPDRCDQGNLEW